MRSAAAPDVRSGRLGATLYYGGLRAVGATAIRRHFQRSGPVLCYHNVAPAGSRAPADSSLHMRADCFEQQMRWLSTHYRVVELDEYVSQVRAGRTLRRTAAITFDDAYQGVFDCALPILRALGLPATVFVVTAAPGKWPWFWWDDPHLAAQLTPEGRHRLLNQLRGDQEAILRQASGSPGVAPLAAAYRPADWNTIRAHIGNGIALGVHTATHRNVRTLSDIELEVEIVDSRMALHAATGVRAMLFAYPYGYSNQRAESLVREAGYAAGFGLDPRRRGRTADLWRLGRLNIPSALSGIAFEAWTTGFHPRAVH